MTSKRRALILGISTLVLSLFVLSFLIMFGIYIYSQTDSSDSSISYSNLYVSDNTEVLSENPTTTENTSTNLDSSTPTVKQGVIKEDPSRQILSTNTILSESEIKILEDTYNVTFTSDTPKNGVYVINTNDESNLDGLNQELDSNTETDVPVKMTGEVIDWGVSRIGANQVWSTASGTGIKVAVIDTGVELTHQDLSSRVVFGYDFVNNDNDPSDDNGHGTHVAGIIASTKNSLGTIGVANTATIFPVKVLNNQGYGYLSDVAKGIYYAADNGARVINLSLGTTTDSSTLKDAISYAAKKGVLIVAAAGNEASSSCDYPAAYSSVICVGATDSNNQLASFSNRGAEISAPGVSDYSTYIGNSYRYMSGTSMATPHVSGAAAVIMSYCKDCSTTKIRSTLDETSVDLGITGVDSIFGYGLVDLVAATNSLSTTVDIPITTPTTDTNSSTQAQTESKTNSTQDQVIKIIEPEADNNRYDIKQAGDITIKFALDPILDTSNIDKIILTLNNTKLYETNNQEGEFVITSSMLDHSQHWIRVTAYFKDGKHNSDNLVLDTTFLRLSTLRNTAKNVLGISDFTGFGQFLFGF